MKLLRAIQFAKSRLGNARNYTSNASDNRSAIRNVGILAHIDAGKTTATERMLFYAGYMAHVGEVHTGNTVMDYMEQERERGITINSAAITFPWKKHQVNLIDTPGHVDFTIEVERALRVLDGAVVILDGSAGVEAQTRTVWRQANRNKVPRICFINKLDKRNSRYDYSLQSIRSKLHVEPVCVQLPINEGKEFSGIVDLVNQSVLTWERHDGIHDISHGRQFQRVNLCQKVHGAELFEKCIEARSQMIDKLCDVDDELADKVLQSESYESISPSCIHRSLRMVTLLSDHPLMVTLCGSAYKNVGIQPLMDAILQYLPAPNEVAPPEAVKKYFNDTTCGLVFKITHDKHKGALSFVRIYSGQVKQGDALYNMTTKRSEQIGQLLVAFADEFKPVSNVTEGNIAVLAGMKDTVTGDTLVASSSVAKAAVKAQEGGAEDDAISPCLSGIVIPDPVFHACIEPASVSQEKNLDMALMKLSREDPSLRVNANEETAQTVLSGMGELHLEILLDRIHKEYKVDAELSRLLIAFKEAPTCPVRLQTNFHRRMYDKDHNVDVDLEVKPIDDPDSFSLPQLIWSANPEARETLDYIKPWQRKAVQKGFLNAIECGPLLGYPILCSNFILNGLTISRGTSDTVIASAINDAVKQTLEEAKSSLLEPIMNLEISAEREVSQIVSQDLLMRRGNILDVHEEPGEEGLHHISATAPLFELRGYSSQVRKITSGKAFLSMELSHYAMMDKRHQDIAYEEITGFPPKH